MTNKDESALPEWTRIKADIADTDQDNVEEQRPVAPARPTKKPATPARTAVPGTTGGAVPGVPVTPPPAAAPIEATKPKPVTPAATPAPAPTTAPAPAPATPAYQQPAVTGRQTKKRSTPAAPPPGQPLWTEMPDSSRGLRGTAQVKRGGRWKVIAVRTTVWGAIGIVMLAGLASIVGPKAPNIAKLTSEVLASVGRPEGFPAEAGEQQAAAFLTTYMNINEAGYSARKEALARFFADGTIPTGLDMTVDDTQRVVAGPILAATPEAVDDTHVVYTFGVQIARGKDIDPQTGKPFKAPIWVYVSVPMVSDENGGVAVAAAPALVPAPAVANTVEPITLDNDEEVAKDAKKAIELYLGYWAKSSQDEMEPYLREDSTSTAKAGLGGSNVTFDAMYDLKVEKLDGTAASGKCEGPDFAAPCRKATATVVWKTGGGLSFRQSYRLTIFKDGENWRILDIRGGNYSR